MRSWIWLSLGILRTPKRSDSWSGQTPRACGSGSRGARETGGSRWCNAARMRSDGFVRHIVRRLEWSCAACAVVLASAQEDASWMLSRSGRIVRFGYRRSLSVPADLSAGLARVDRAFCRDRSVANRLLMYFHGPATLGPALKAPPIEPRVMSREFEQESA